MLGAGTFENVALHNIYILAPSNVVVTSLSTTGFDVSLSAYTGDPHVSSFIVNVKGIFINKTCSLSRQTSPLACHFTGLASGSQYTIRARACFPEQLVCSEPSKHTTWTVPTGKFITSFLE